jgi:putative ABC transport system permease protein
MKPLSCYTYIKSNKKKVLPSFICTIISVSLIYLFGLLLYGSVEDFYKPSVNVVKIGTLVYTNNTSNPLSERTIMEIKNNTNVSEIIPMLGMNNTFSYSAAFGTAGTPSFIFYSEDIKSLLRNLKLELVEGTIPKNNANELLLPIELAKQYKLKVGDYINNETNQDMHLNRTYRLVGITKGDVWMPMVCDVGAEKREVALKYGLMFFFKDINNKTLNDRIIAFKDKNVVVQEYKSMKEEMNQTISSIDLLYISLDIMILLVLCMSLGNLNYIVFLNRKNEFAILATIGFSKAKLRIKLFMENSIVCFVGFLVGIGFTTFICILLNITIWNPDGKSIAVFRLSSVLVAFIIPIMVAFLSMISSLREFNKLNHESLSI